LSTSHIVLLTLVWLSSLVSPQDSLCGGSLPPPVVIAVLPELSGQWVVSFSADSGPARGRVLNATLHLKPTTPAQQSGTSRIDGRPTVDSAYVYYGSLSRDLRPVGALRAGAVNSNDPGAPGVQVHFRRGTTEGRVEAEVRLRPAPPHDSWEAVLDGDYTTLSILRYESSKWTGTWESGGGENAVRARGRFCAIRTHGE
jgi:hypothetical protein